MNIQKYLAIIFSVFIFYSCNKSEQTQDDPVQNLTDKYFILTDATSNPAYPMGNGTNSSDLYHDWYKEPCVLDDLRMFKSNGDLVYDNGQTKCDPAEPQSAFLKWTFIENNSKIRVTQGVNSDTLKVLINNGTILKYEKKKTSSTTGPLVYIWTETWHIK